MLAVAVVVVVAVFGVPSAIEATTDEKLEGLQSSQDANVSDDANLALEEVDYSSREAVVANLPTRIRDVLLRPYPWQIDNASQQLGLGRHDRHALSDRVSRPRADHRSPRRS